MESDEENEDMKRLEEALRAFLAALGRVGQDCAAFTSDFFSGKWVNCGRHIQTISAPKSHEKT